MALVLINTLEDLYNIRDDLTGDYQLVRDLDFNDDDSYADPTTNKSIYTTGEGWLPIWNHLPEPAALGFSGDFDGNDKTISNLYINRPAGEAQALFGATETSSNIHNLGLIDVNVTGAEGTAGLIGNNEGFVDKCSVTGNITGTEYVGGLVGVTQVGDITCCHTNITINAGQYAGGLVAINYYGLIENCSSQGSVTSTAYTGGLVSFHLLGTLSNCWSHASANGFYVAGGLVGENWMGESIIANCYSTGAATGFMLVGGFTGTNQGAIYNSMWDTESSGNATSTGGTGHTTAEMKDINTYLTAHWSIAELANWVDEKWIIDGDYPYSSCDYVAPVITIGEKVDSIYQNTSEVDSEESEPLNSIYKDEDKLESSIETDMTSIARQGGTLSSIINRIKESISKNKKLESEHEEL